MKKRHFLIVLIVCLYGCKKDPVKIMPIADGLPVTVTLELSHPGYTIPSTFEGLSFETEVLSKNPSYLNADNKVFIQLIKNLGPGLMRIGGNSSDEITWTGAPVT